MKTTYRNNEYKIFTAEDATIAKLSGETLTETYIQDDEYTETYAEMFDQTKHSQIAGLVTDLIAIQNLYDATDDEDTYLALEKVFDSLVKDATEVIFADYSPIQQSGINDGRIFFSLTGIFAECDEAIIVPNCHHTQLESDLRDLTRWYSNIDDLFDCYRMTREDDFSDTNIEDDLEALIDALYIASFESQDLFEEVHNIVAKYALMLCEYDEDIIEATIAGWDEECQEDARKSIKEYFAEV